MRKPPAPAVSPEERLVQAYRQTFTSEDGALVLDDLRKAYGRRRSFVGGASDVTAFQEGQRDVYLRIMAYLDPELTDEEEMLP